MIIIFQIVYALQPIIIQQNIDFCSICLSKV